MPEQKERETPEQKEREAFVAAFDTAMAARREWEKLKAIAAAWQEKAFAARGEYYEAARVLEDARKAWDEAERRRQ